MKTNSKRKNQIISFILLLMTVHILSMRCDKKKKKE